MNSSKFTLNRWLILLSNLVDTDNKDIPELIERTSMMFDGSLTEKETYSHRYIKNVLRPRVIKAKAYKTDSDMRELFFPKETYHDAYVEIRKILQTASKSIYLIDPYLDTTIFTVLKTIPFSSIKVKLSTFNFPDDFVLEARKFLSQYTNYSIELRKNREFHDRFIVIDRIKCWHLGCSIKDAGKRAFMLNLVEDYTNKRALMRYIKNAWRNSQEEVI
jgi:hypothetical protein